MSSRRRAIPLRGNTTVNDAGLQIQLLGVSVAARMREPAVRLRRFQKRGTRGGDIKELANAWVEQEGGTEAAKARLAEPEYVARLGARAAEKYCAMAQADLERYGVRFDRWFSERTLHDAGDVLEAVQVLLDGGHAEKREGATWLKTTEEGDDKDRVLVRATGEPTYFAADLAYHSNKFARGFDRRLICGGPITTDTSRG